jgi:hypothetical protein
MHIEKNKRRQRDMDDEAVERCGCVLRQAPASPQDDAERKAHDKERDVFHARASVSGAMPITDRNPVQ